MNKAALKGQFELAKRAGMLAFADAEAYGSARDKAARDLINAGMCEKGPEGEELKYGYAFLEELKSAIWDYEHASGSGPGVSEGRRAATVINFVNEKLDLFKKTGKFEEPLSPVDMTVDKTWIEARTKRIA